MFTNSFDLNQPKALLTQCFFRGVTRAASAEIKFSEGFYFAFTPGWLILRFAFLSHVVCCL